MSIIEDGLLAEIKNLLSDMVEFSQDDADDHMCWAVDTAKELLEKLQGR